jgi:GntR family transcriptional repressor for pyruvate dehydrogenase complex
LARALGREKEKLSEVFEFRMMLEPQIAALAADNADTTDIEALERLVLDQQSEGDSIERFFDLDRSFHLRLARATGNSVVLRIMERINDILAESRTESQARPERVATSLSGHRAVLAAVKRKNADEARRKMYEHLQEIEQIVIHGVDSHPRK